MRTRTVRGALLVAWLLGAFGCDGDHGGMDPSGPPPLRAADGSLAVRVVLPADAGEGLTWAAGDLVVAMATIVGAEVPADGVLTDAAAAGERAQVRVHIDASAEATYGEQGYGYVCEGADGTLNGLEVVAATPVGAQYGLYGLAAELGVQYIHPEETFFPEDPDAMLPWSCPAVPVRPAFALRGFHEHTQHPIVASDLFLRPGDDQRRELASHLVRWLARNRQNVLTFHMLKTVDLERWLPYIADIVAEGQALGIHMGLYVSFADQQQNGFRLIREDELDPETGEVVADAKQITDGLDRLLSAGFDVVGVQIGTSEFTKPDEARALAWMDTAVAHLAENHPSVDIFAWIHTTCDLETEQGGYYYHLPLQADLGLAAYVHTTMFYTLEHPAPVYACDSFAQQKDFLEAAAAQGRRQVYFPESAWWLGFDNNLPLAMPITGWSRAHDILEVLPRYTRTGDAPYQVEGHATFTTGREWAYWQYDHFLTRITWDGRTTWDAYLDSLKPLYGAQGTAVAQALRDWTALQKRHFYDEDPLIYFYLAGELPQDELGALAGLAARRPKVAYRDVIGYDDATFAAWITSDYDKLGTMRDEYAALADPLPATLAEGTEQQQRLYAELREVLTVFVRRLDHTIALYDGVIAARDFFVEKSAASQADPPREPAAALRTATLERAEQRLADAQAVSAEMKALFGAAEARYRYPIELLARPKPESPTAYPFGYLYETSTAYFWTRRDDQLAVLIGEVFGSVTEEWIDPAPSPLFVANADGVELLQPESEVARQVLRPFIPPMIAGIAAYDVVAVNFTLSLSQDYDASGLPDPGTELRVDGQLVGAEWTGQAPEYALTVRNNTGEVLGNLTLLQPAFRADVEQDATGVTGLPVLELVGALPSPALVNVVVSATGGGIDPEGIGNLIKEVFGYPASEPLPDTLPFALRFTFGPAQ